MNSLERHQKFHCSKLESKRKFTCDVCKKSYLRQSSLDNHKKYDCKNSRPFKCPTCEAKFNRKHHLERHARNCIKYVRSVT